MRIKKELTIFVVFFVLLSFSMHYKEFLEYPLTHIQLLSKSSLGLFHPIFLTIIFYIIVLFIRSISSFIINLIKK